MLLLLLACSSDYETIDQQNTAPHQTGETGGTTAGTTPEEESPSPYIYEEEEEEPPLLTIDEVGEALDEAFDTFFSLDPQTWQTAYNDALSAEDSNCPYYYDYYVEYYGYEYWYGGCSSNGGTAYNGYLYGWQYDEPTYGSYYVYNSYGWRYGEGTAEMADGQRFEMAGYFYTYEINYYPGQSYSPTYLYSSMSGEALWDGELYAGTWLENNLSLSLTYSAGTMAGYGSYNNIAGGISNLPGTANAIYFDGVYIAETYWGSDCPTEPSGLISIRDDNGEWYNVEFDGPAYSGAATFAPGCDGCGTVWYRGEDMGQVCLDFTRFTSWETRPW